MADGMAQYEPVQHNNDGVWLVFSLVIYDRIREILLSFDSTVIKCCWFTATFVHMAGKMGNEAK